MWAEAEGEMLSDKINVVVENGTITAMNFTIDHKKCIFIFILLIYFLIAKS